MTKVISFFGSILFFFASMFPFLFSNFPKTPSGQKVDMTKFELTWKDEFDGDTLDRTKWDTHDWLKMRKGGYWNKEMVSVHDGNLDIATKYVKDGLDGSPGGYYTGVVETRINKDNVLFEQCYGYFECRCILPPSTGMWSAFWMMNEGVYNIDGSGEDGTEVDIFESMRYKDHWWKAGDSVVSGIHYDNYGPESKGDSIGYWFTGNNPYEEYTTYGLEWNKDEYIFYITGVETGRITKGGVSDNPEYLILSTEIAGENGVANADRHGTGEISLPQDGSAVHFLVDYVRVYQYKDLL